MIGDRLIIDRDTQDGTAWLILASSAGVERKALLLLRHGFGLEHLVEALKATGWIQPLENEWRLTHHLGCEALRDMVEAILAYFDEPDRPSQELLRIQTAAAAADERVRESGPAIPLYAFAWLDLMVREDLADEARSDTRIWSESPLTFDVAQACSRRIGELVARYAPETAGAARLAPSMSTRPSATPRTKLG